MSTLNLREPSPPNHAESDRRQLFLYCTTGPLDDVSPVVRPLLRLTFWAGRPCERMRYRDVVTAASHLLRPDYHDLSRDALRKVARRYVRDVIALPDSPIVRTHAELMERRHA